MSPRLLLAAVLLVLAGQALADPIGAASSVPSVDPCAAAQAATGFQALSLQLVSGVRLIVGIFLAYTLASFVFKLPSIGPSGFLNKIVFHLVVLPMGLAVVGSILYATLWIAFAGSVPPPSCL